VTGKVPGGSGLAAARNPGNALGSRAAAGFHQDHLDLTGPADSVAGVSSGLVRDLIERAGREDYPQWLEHVAHAAACTRPVRLTGQLESVNTATGVVTTFSTDTLPDREIYKACGNRRASVCPACAQVYRQDTYQLIHAGIAGGKNVPPSVRAHPFAFVTLTAPSFGLVHSTRAKNGRPRPCRPRRSPQVCPHGVALACPLTHHEGDPVLGQPLCLDCYDHDHQVVWNAMSGELWRRTTATLAKHLKRLGARASFGKVAEMQTRGVVHFHAIIRLDHLHPDLAVIGGQLAEVPAPPPAGVTLDTLDRLLTHAVSVTSFTSLPHADRPHGWPIAWGAQLDVRPVTATVRQELGTGPIAETAVAGYLAKYATKGTETTGHSSARLTPDTVAAYASLTTHTGRLIDACWHLGRPGADLDPVQAEKNSGRLAYGRLRRWAHMLGFGGHFSTKSRRYSTTLGQLRQARVDYRRDAIAHRLADELGHTDDTTLLVGSLAFAGSGWHTTGDALLANTAAAMARERRQTAKEETAHETGQFPHQMSTAA
jgi:hypothetical protein